MTVLGTALSAGVDRFNLTVRGADGRPHPLRGDGVARRFVVRIWILARCSFLVEIVFDFSIGCLVFVGVLDVLDRIGGCNRRNALFLHA
jgi:hypothetical protein